MSCQSKPNAGYKKPPGQELRNDLQSKALWDQEWEVLMLRPEESYPGSLNGCPCWDGNMHLREGMVWRQSYHHFGHCFHDLRKNLPEPELGQ